MIHGPRRRSSPATSRPRHFGAVLGHHPHFKPRYKRPCFACKNRAPPREDPSYTIWTGDQHDRVRLRHPVCVDEGDAERLLHLFDEDFGAADPPQTIAFRLDTSYFSRSISCRTPSRRWAPPRSPSLSRPGSGKAAPSGPAVSRGKPAWPPSRSRRTGSPGVDVEHRYDRHQGVVLAESQNVCRADCQGVQVDPPVEYGTPSGFPVVAVV